MDNIIENNKLIAEFMGVFDKILSTGNIHSWSDAPFYYTTEDTKEKVIKNICKYSKYDSDWNWLMEVVEKIETLSEFDKLPEFFIMYDNREEFKGWYWSIEVPKKFNKECFKHNNREETKIEAYYNSCLEFIKWYNEQNKNNEKHTCIIDK